jgi:hypothetical protein
VASLDVDTAALAHCADRFESIRDQLNPAGLPVGFEPAGADPASAVAATRISMRAAGAVNDLWGIWSELGRVAGLLRASAAGYIEREQDSIVMLSGGAGGRGPNVTAPAPELAPVVVPQVFCGRSCASPEELSVALREGAGADGAESFAGRWSAHTGLVAIACEGVLNARRSLASVWSGSAHDRAASAITAVHGSLVRHHDTAAGVHGGASAHAADYRKVNDGVPQPVQFATWHQDLDSAVAANDQYPGVYTGAVLSAQQQLGNGYGLTGEAYGQYAADPATGELIDPLSGARIDPLTGEPIRADPDSDFLDPEHAQEMLAPAAGLLTGLLGGVSGAVSSAVGGLAQGGQQLAQMASQGAGQLVKRVGPAATTGGGGALPDVSGIESASGGEGSAVGAPQLAPASGTVTAPPSPPATLSRPAVGGRLPAPGSGVGGGMGMPFMPMTGPTHAGQQGKPSTSPDGKKLLPPSRANTQKVIGQAPTERISDKRQQREQRMMRAKERAADAAGDGKAGT